MIFILLQTIFLTLFYFNNSMYFLGIAFGVLIIYLMPKIRYQFFNLPLYRLLKMFMPKISDTEYQALVAGDAWTGEEIFKLFPCWRKITSYESNEISSQEQEYIDNIVDGFCAICDDWEINNTGVPDKVYDYIKQHKMWSFIIPKEYGGLEFSSIAQSKIITKISSKSVNAAIIAMVPNSLGPAELLIKYGTKEQKQHYLPKLATGEEIPCFGLTSNTVGSDAGSLSDSGVICYGEYEGKEVLGIRFSCYKRYITLAPIATIISVAIRLFDPDQLLSKDTDLGITLCMIPATHPGVQTGPHHLPMDMKFPNGTIEAVDVFIPMDWIVGGQEYIGKGWSMLMECLSIGRSLSLPALSCGLAHKSIIGSIAYTSVREQFNLPIIKFEGIVEKLANIIGYSHIINVTNKMTIDALSRGKHPSVESAIAKYHLTELGRTVTNDTMDILAGKAVQFGKKNFFGNTYQAVPIAITVEGANILTRNLIIYGQGIMRFHPLLLKEVNCFQDPTEENVATFNKLILLHVARYVTLLIKHLYYIAATPITWLLPKQQRLRHYTNAMANRFALLSEFILVYFGKSFKLQENISALMGDVMSYIYMNYALDREYSLSNNSYMQKTVYNWSTEFTEYKINQAFRDIFVLFPSNILRHIFRWFFFPLPFSKSKKYLRTSKKLVNGILKDEKFFKNMSSLCYVGDNSADLDILLRAFNMLPGIRKIHQKLQKHRFKVSAIRNVSQIENCKTKLLEIISLEDLAELLEYTRLLEEIVAVDVIKEQA